ncbi:MAG: hypothetical protein AB1Z98_20225 [Nannocystaceae bacterium]
MSLRSAMMLCAMLGACDPGDSRDDTPTDRTSDATPCGDPLPDRDPLGAVLVAPEVMADVVNWAAASEDRMLFEDLTANQESGSDFCAGHENDAGSEFSVCADDHQELRALLEAEAPKATGPQCVVLATVEPYFAPGVVETYSGSIGDGVHNGEGQGAAYATLVQVESAGNVNDVKFDGGLLSAASVTMTNVCFTDAGRRHKIVDGPEATVDVRGTFMANLNLTNEVDGLLQGKSSANVQAVALFKQYHGADDTEVCDDTTSNTNNPNDPSECHLTEAQRLFEKGFQASRFTETDVDTDALFDAAQWVWDHGVKQALEDEAGAVVLAEGEPAPDTPAGSNDKWSDDAKKIYSRTIVEHKGANNGTTRETMAVEAGKSSLTLKPFEPLTLKMHARFAMKPEVGSPTASLVSNFSAVALASDFSMFALIRYDFAECDKLGEWRQECLDANPTGFYMVGARNPEVNPAAWSSWDAEAQAWMTSPRSFDVLSSQAVTWFREAGWPYYLGEGLKALDRVERHIKCVDGNYQCSGSRKPAVRYGTLKFTDNTPPGQ